jgi:hypothetical protein
MNNADSYICTISYCPTSYCPTLYCLTLCCPTSYCPTLCCLTLYCMTLYCLTSYCPTSYCPTWPQIVSLLSHLYLLYVCKHYIVHKVQKTQTRLIFFNQETFSLACLLKLPFMTSINCQDGIHPDPESTFTDSIVIHCKISSTTWLELNHNFNAQLWMFQGKAHFYKTIFSDHFSTIYNFLSSFF